MSLRQEELTKMLTDAGFPYSMDTLHNMDKFQKLIEAEREACAVYLEKEGWTYGAALIRARGKS